MKHIAQAANVSAATVSLVLNRKPGVSAATRQRVLQLTKTLGEGSDLHRHLSGVKSGTVCFVKTVRHGHTLNRDHDVFIAAYLDGLGQEALNWGHNVELTTLSADLAVGPDSLLSLMRNTNAVGFIILGTELSLKDVGQLQRFERPLVFMDTCFDSEPANFVDMDNASAVFQAVEHLFTLGHREIGYVGSSTPNQNFRLRDAAFQQAIGRLGLKVPERSHFTVDSTFDGAYEDMRTLLRTRRNLPSALFVVNDITAYGCLKALKEKGVRVPKDISVVGFDDLPMSTMCEPPLTSIRVMNRHIGRAAMRLLARRIVEGNDMPAEKIQVACKLVVRESSRKT